jgi:hypothetical protein
MADRVLPMADQGWLKQNLSEAQALEHPQAGIGYLFGETSRSGGS